MADHVIHISEAEAASDFAGLLARVRAGAEVVIENGKLPVAVIHAPVPARRSANTSRDINAALVCAEAFLRIAEPLVSKIGDVEESGQSHPFSSSMGDVVTAATNLAFAIELYIKAVLVVSGSDVPGGRDGHNLGKLYAAMPEHFKVLSGHMYEERRKRDWNGRYPSISLAKQPGATNLPEWDDDPKEPLDMGALLDRHPCVFTSWRYIYEFKRPDERGWQYHRLEYGLLLSACRAMRDTIESSRGGSTSANLIDDPK